jgi:uncharacterized protein YyaL (SSP411 family)
MSDTQHTADTSRMNGLANETSPYLLQHVHNPVYWYPWSAEALELARWQKKPILLSIGYSACHWCHVMAHESFENETIAAYMNEHFINIKVDREERPDLDKIYQTAQYLITQRNGGWPLTMFLSPEDQIPFFGGTYFPPESRYGMPGFLNILERVVQYFSEQKEAIRKQNLAFVLALEQTQIAAEGGTDQLDTDILLQGVHGLANNFDVTHGGFGSAPKFPHVSNLDLLMGFGELDRSETGETALQMALFTLEKMANGGIYDHLGGGFARYSVDEQWMIPHFEKMLYDNGTLLTAYAQATCLSDHALFKTVTRETADWLIRDMQHAEGGYFSSLDADSEGEEGRFYVWTPEAVKARLDPPEYELFSRYYGLDGAANFEHHYWHLRVTTPLEECAGAIGLGPDEARQRLQSARNKLLEIRRQRVWPGRDEKILPSWNALAIKGMALAALRLGNDQYYQSAHRALAFIHKHLWREGRLIACYKEGKGHLNAYLDDYAFLLDAILTMLQVRWDTHWLQFAMQLADVLMDQFQDPEGGFYFTSHDHEKLLQRRRDFMDEATPSGNGIAAQALLRLGHLVGNTEWTSAAEQTLQAARQSIRQIPHAHPSLLMLLADLANPPTQVIIRGTAPDLQAWSDQCHKVAGIRTTIYAIPSDEAVLPGLLIDRKPAEATVAYVCSGHSCKTPEFNLEKLISDLKK